MSRLLLKLLCQISLWRMYLLLYLKPDHDPGNSNITEIFMETLWLVSAVLSSVDRIVIKHGGGKTMQVILRRSFQLSTHLCQNQGKSDIQSGFSKRSANPEGRGNRCCVTWAWGSLCHTTGRATLLPGGDGEAQLPQGRGKGWSYVTSSPFDALQVTRGFLLKCETPRFSF